MLALLLYPEQDVSLAFLVGQINVIKILLPVLAGSQPVVEHLLGVFLGESFLGYHVLSVTVDIVKGLGKTSLVKKKKGGWGNCQ